MSRILRRTARALAGLSIGLLIASALPAAARGQGTGTYLVELRGSVDAAREASRLARDHGGRARFVYDAVLNGFAFEGTEAEAARLARDRRVERLEPDGIVHLADDPPARARQLQIDNADAARTSGYTGAGATIAVLDTGLDRGHRAFRDHGNVAGTHGRCGGTRHVRDYEGHGTAVASNAVGRIGVAHEAKLYAVKVFAGAGRSTTLSRVICGLNHVRKWNAAHPGQEIDVVNLSLAGAGSRTYRRAIKRLVASGVVVVAAAGNAGGKVQFPARYGAVIGVTALNKTGQRMAGWSSGGKGADLTAPGARVLIARAGARFTRSSGTSYSSPQVAGAVAVVLALDPTADALDVLTRTGTCPNGDINGTSHACAGPRWKGDDAKPEPRINVLCAAIEVDPASPPVPAECA